MITIFIHITIKWHRKLFTFQWRPGYQNMHNAKQKCIRMPYIQLFAFFIVLMYPPKDFKEQMSRHNVSQLKFLQCKTYIRRTQIWKQLLYDYENMKWIYEMKFIYRVLYINFFFWKCFKKKLLNISSNFFFFFESTILPVNNGK